MGLTEWYYKWFVKKYSPIVNKAYAPIFNDEERIKLLYGGRCAGRSYFTAQFFLEKVCNESGYVVLTVRKEAESIKNSVFTQFVDIIKRDGLTWMFNINYSPMEITHLVTGSKIVFGSVDDWDSLMEKSHVEHMSNMTNQVKVIPIVTDIWIEEATEITEDDFTRLNFMLRGKSKLQKHLFMTFNPDTTDHWIYESFFVKQVYKCSKYYTTCYDNDALSRETKDRIKLWHGPSLSWSITPEFSTQPEPIFVSFKTDNKIKDSIKLTGVDKDGNTISMIAYQLPNN